MPTFSFKPIVKQIRNIARRNNYLEHVENNIIGAIYLNEEGEFIVKYDNKFYKLTKDSLELKGKKVRFVFNKNVNNCIIKVINIDNDINNYGFPYMAVAPGYEVTGNILKDRNNNEYFEINKVLDSVDMIARAEFLNNKYKLIKIYNERNKTIDSC